MNLVVTLPKVGYLHKQLHKKFEEIVVLVDRTKNLPLPPPRFKTTTNTHETKTNSDS